MREGKFTRYTKDGKVDKIYHYVNDKLHGVQIVYINGNISMTLQYINGTMHGKYREYYESRKIKIDANYTHGKLDGSYVKYFPNGTVEISTVFRNGKIHGTLIKNQHGSEHIPFKDGMIHGIYVKWSIYGRICIMASFKDGMKHGPYYVYNHDPYGIAISGNYENNKLHGEYRNIYTEEVIMYKHGVRHGKYVGGNLHCTYIDGKVHGKWTLYNTIPSGNNNGDIFIQDTYIHGVMVIDE